MAITNNIIKMNSKILILNLQRNPEKRKNIEDQFKKLNIKDYLFFPAIDGKYITNNIDVKIGVGYGVGRQLTKTEIAIIMGHINMLQYTNANNLENIIILEDDVILCDDFNERLDKILKDLPNDWEYVYLSGHSDYEKFPIVSSQKIVKSPKMIGAFSYMVNKTAYQKLINFCLSFMTTYDDMIMQMISLKRLNSYTVFPFLTYIGDTYSENGKSITKNHPSKLYFKNYI